MIFPQRVSFKTWRTWSGRLIKLTLKLKFKTHPLSGMSIMSCHPSKKCWSNTQKSLHLHFWEISLTAPGEDGGGLVKSNESRANVLTNVKRLFAVYSDKKTVNASNAIRLVWYCGRKFASNVVTFYQKYQPLLLPCLSRPTEPPPGRDAQFPSCQASSHRGDGAGYKVYLKYYDYCGLCCLVRRAYRGCHDRAPEKLPTGWKNIEHRYKSSETFPSGWKVIAVYVQCRRCLARAGRLKSVASVAFLVNLSHQQSEAFKDEGSGSGAAGRWRVVQKFWWRIRRENQTSAAKLRPACLLVCRSMGAGNRGPAKKYIYIPKARPTRWSSDKSCTMKTLESRLDPVMVGNLQRLPPFCLRCHHHLFPIQIWINGGKKL